MTVEQIYKVMVWAQAEDGGFVTVVELAAPVEMLVQFAPAAVAAALGTTVQDASFGRRIDPTPEPESDTGQPARRKRRTKEQIAADEAEAKLAAERINVRINESTAKAAAEIQRHADQALEDVREAEASVPQAPVSDKPYSPFG